MQPMLAALAMVCARSTFAAPMASQFSSWMQEHGKVYASDEEIETREQIFNANLAKIEQHNARAENGEFTYFMGLGPFTDLTSEEWEATLSPYVRTTERNVVELPEIENAFASPVDWVAKGATTPVKSQGDCGACWAFSATGAIEGAWQIAGHKLQDLSEQQLVDCAGGRFRNKGCLGGDMGMAMEYVKSVGGLTDEDNYQYQAHDGTCNERKAAEHVATVSGSVDVRQNSESQLIAAVARGPVSVAIEADKNVFQHYSRGVFSSTTCGVTLDHGVLVVGYGTDAATGSKYFKIKNSWGPSWGESGFIRFAAGTGSAKGVCGINMQPVYATAPKGDLPPSPPAPPPSPDPPGSCDMPDSERDSCGYFLSESQCEARGCCYDDSSFWDYYCFDKTASPPSGSHYGKPSNGDCTGGDSPVSLSNVPGSFCSPSCNNVAGTCPAGPAGSDPECALTTGGSKVPDSCALICSVSGGHGGTCPPGATCHAVSGTGICTYPN